MMGRVILGLTIVGTIIIGAWLTLVTQWLEHYDPTRFQEV